MNLPERGAYITLLCLCWIEGSLPADHAALGRLCRVPTATFARIWPALAPCFTVLEGRLVQGRLDKEREKQAAYRQQQSARGKLGGRPEKKAMAFSGKASVKPDKSSSISDLPSASPDHTERCVEIAPDEEALAYRAGQLVERYAELFLLHRRGARYHSRIHLDFMKAQELVKTWPDDARLEKLAVIVLTTDDVWISGTDRGFGVFAAKATWADDRLSAWEAAHPEAAH